MVTDDVAFPRVSIWLSTDLGAPFVLQRLVVLALITGDQCAFYRAGRRFAWVTDDFPGENLHDLLVVFSTRARL